MTSSKLEAFHKPNRLSMDTKMYKKETKIANDDNNATEEEDATQQDQMLPDLHNQNMESKEFAVALEDQTMRQTNNNSTGTYRLSANRSGFYRYHSKRR